jgi:hypothetical protein
MKKRKQQYSANTVFTNLFLEKLKLAVTTLFILKNKHFNKPLI